MNPEQQAEYRRRENRKNFAATTAMNTLIQLLQVQPEKTDDELVNRAWNLGIKMATAMSDRECEPG